MNIINREYIDIAVNFLETKQEISMSKYMLILEHKSERHKCLNKIKPLGARVVHDSSGRVVVIEAHDKKQVEKNLPKGATLVDISKKFSGTLKNMDESETLFLSALEKRYSKKYRTMKDSQIPGESQEEIEFFSAPHTPED